MIYARPVAILALVSLVPFGTAFLKSETLSPAAPSPQTFTSSQATVGQAFQNIQAFTDLKDHPSQELWAAMTFIAGSLSVRCDYCHDAQSGPYTSDAKQTKRTARNMIRMVRDINNTSFGGRQVVTCYTCHQGSPHPSGTPVPWYKTREEIAAYAAAAPPPNLPNTPSAGQPAPPPAPAPPAPALPSVDQVMADYRKAVGAGAMKSLRLSGVNETSLGPAVPFEFEALLPGRASLNTQGGANRTVVNRDQAFRVTPQGIGPLPTSAPLVRKSNIEPFLPVKYETADAPRTVAGIETIKGRRYYVVESHPAGPAGTPALVERLYFDVQTGLLFKIRNETPTPLGNIADERVYEDYRTVSGVTLSYLITSHYMQQQGLFRISDIQTNVELDPARFEPPPPKEHKVIAVDPKVLDTYVGTYGASPSPTMTISREGSSLFLTVGAGQKVELFAETETGFFAKTPDAEVTFVKDDKGQVTALGFNGGPGVIRLPRVK